MTHVADESSLIDRVAELDFAKRTAERLHQKYPGYLWGVNAGGGVVSVLLLDSLSQMGFALNYIRTFSASDMDKQIDMLAGELLERYRLKRGAADQAQIDAARRDVAGRMILET
ncbi:MAG: hypothetical protein E6Q97_26015 [Desulfurellales bacterium]|nr:MAG: hypothetical protein E6Q97_26015 [Desulfurellales bacterium]